MRRLSLALALLLALAAVAVFTASPGEECSTLVATGAATVDGAPLLWKNRDTSRLSNKVVFVNDVPHSYLAVANAEDAAGRMAWGGVNDAGFAIGNSVAYNVPAPASGDVADLEGIIMADALRTCATVDDFEQHLRKRLGRDLGAQTNFIVIDAKGGASIFETHNRGFERLDASAAPRGYLANTNFSRTGRENQGMGYLRFDRESALLEAAPGGRISAEYVLQVVARDLGHALLTYPGRDEWKKLPASKPYWVHATYTINRSSTASVMVVRGVKPGEDPARTTMWVALGEPVTAIAVPLWVSSGEVPPELSEGEAAPLSEEASRLKGLLRPLASRERQEYVDVTCLDNASGTGWLPTTLAVEREIMKEADSLLARKASPKELAAFSRAAAAKALATLKGIKGKGPTSLRP